MFFMQQMNVWWYWKFDLSANCQTLEAASATGKYCTNYDAEVKALEQGAQAVIDLTDTNSEDVVFLTDSRSVLDLLAGPGEHNLKRKLYSI